MRAIEYIEISNKPLQPMDIIQVINQMKSEGNNLLHYRFINNVFLYVLGNKPYYSPELFTAILNVILTSSDLITPNNVKKAILKMGHAEYKIARHLLIKYLKL